MMRRASTTRVDRSKKLGLALVALSLAACSEGDAQKSWNEFSTCLAGPAAQSALSVRLAQLRSIALGNTASLADKSDKTGWPARCANPADDLYAALGTGSEGALLKRKLHERLACADTKGTCTLPTDSSLISVATELWGVRRERWAKDRSGARGRGSASRARRAAEQRHRGRASATNH